MNFVIKDESEYQQTVIPAPDVIDNSQIYKVRVRFKTPILGSKPMKRDIFEQYMLPNNPNPANNIEDLEMIEYGIRQVHNLLRSNEKEDVAAFIESNQIDLEDENLDDDDLNTSGITGFLCDQNLDPYLDAYLPKAMFKEAWISRKYHPNTLSMKMKTGKSIISRHVFISGTDHKRPTKMKLNVPYKDQISILSRALRAETRQGPRTALAVSVILPKDTWFEFYLSVLAPDLVTPSHLHEWLSYGQYNGFGQFRGGNYGTFSYTLSLMEKKK